MSTATKKDKPSQRSHRPKAATVFAAAFIAGAAAAFGVNRALDVHLAQSKPQVESEPIFVALRSLPQGSMVTVWDVALRDWPKAMMPMAAVRSHDSFDGQILKHPLREGQPLLTVQLVKAPATTDSQVVGSATLSQPLEAALPQPDLWAPGEQAAVAAPAAVPQVAPATPAVAAVAAVAEVAEVAAAAPAATPPAATTRVEDQATAVRPAEEPTVADEQARETSLEAPAAEPAIVSVVQPALEPKQPVAGGTVQQNHDAASPVIAPATSASVVRYLVVPERIALQADRSFMPATQASQQPPARQQPAPQQPAPQQPIVQQTPPVRQAPQQQAKYTRQRQARTPGAQPGNDPNQQLQRTVPNRPRPAPPAPRGKVSAFQSMFPNLAAGMDAVEDQFEKIKRERQAEPDSEAEPAPELQAEEAAPQRSALLRFSRG